MRPECLRCLDTGLVHTAFGTAYCDCDAGKEAEETNCLSNDDANEEPADFGDQ